MSQTIDQRVVEMRFDNSHFEKNVSTTMSTLDKFKEKLNLSGAAKGLDNVGEAAKKVNVNPLATAAESVSLKFSALEVMAVTALTNITNSALNAGKKIVSALTIDPVKMGFSEYETQINAVQTILANTQSKGTTLDDVNNALDELNTYADKTIYNFTEMTRNIGTFTAAGVDLDTAVAAIKGIANLAAVSGSTSQQASTAMYQLSQALASGTVKLMDWNSVVNAGMGGQVFQDALKETARAHGIAIDQMIEEEGSFRETLKSGWLSSEVLTETLSKFTGDLNESQLKTMGYTEEQIAGILKMGQTANDAATKVKTFSQLFDTLKEAAQSGWTQTWEIIIGDFEEAKELFTEISDAFGKVLGNMADARNKLLKGALSSKWSELEEQVKGVGISFDDFQEKLKETARSHGVEIDAMIEKEGSLEKTLKNGWLTSGIIAETLRSYTTGISDASKATEDISGKLEKFQGIVDQVINGDFGNGEERIKALTEAGYDYAEIQGLVNHVLLGTTTEIGDLSDAQLENLGYTEEQIAAIRLLAEEAEKAGTPLNELIADLEKPSGRELLIDTFRNAITGLSQAIGAVRDAWLEAFPPMTSEQLYGIIEKIHALSEGLVMSEGNVDKLKRTFDGLFAILDIFTTLTGGAFKVAIKTLCKVLGLADVNILDVTASAGDAIVAFRDWLFENNLLVKGLEKVGNVIFGAAKKVKDWFLRFSALPEVQSAFEKFKNSFVKGLSAFRDWASKSGTAIWNFVKKLKAWFDKFKELPNVQSAFEKFKTGVSNVLTALKNAFGACGDSTKELINKLKNLDKITLEDIIVAFKDFKDKIVGHFSTIGGSFDGIKNALKTFKDEFLASLGESGEGLAKFAKKIFDFFKSIKDKIEYNFGFGEILAVALGVGTIGVTKKIADALDALANPLVSFGGLLDGIRDAIKGFNGVMKGAKFYLVAQSFTALATGIILLAGAVALLTLLDQGKLWSAVGVIAALGGVVVAIATAMTALNKSAVKGAKNAVSIIAIAGAVLALVIALKMLSDLNVTEIVGGITALVAMMAALVAASIALAKFAPKMFSGSIALIAFAAAILILVQALKNITKIDCDNINESLLALVVIMGSLALVTAACKGVKIGAALTALAVVVALKLLINMLDDIAAIDLGMISSNLGSFATIFAMLIGLMVSSKLAGQHAAKAGVAILAVSVALLLIVSVIKQLAKLDPEMLSAPVAVIAILMTLFAGIIAVSALAGNNAAKAGAMLLMMAAAIVVLGVVVALLSKLEPDGLWRAVGAIAALEACFIALIFITKFAGQMNTVKSTLVILTVAIGLLAAALIALSLLDEDSVLAATVALSAVMGVFALLVASTKLATGANGTLIIMTAVVAALGGILYLLADLPVESTLAVAASLSVLLLALSASCAILAGVGATGQAGLVGIGVLAALIVAVGALITGIGALVDGIPKIEEWLDKGLPILEKIGYGLGNFFGSIVGGFADGAMAGLPGIAESLSSFMKKLEPFLDGIRGIDDEMVSGVKSLVEIVLLLTAANLIEGIASWLTGGRSVVEFAAQLPALGLALASFSETVKGKVDEEAVNTAANAGKMLTELANTVPNSGGLLGFIVGNNDIGEFATQLPILAQGIVNFSKTVKGKVDEEAVTVAANAGKVLTELADTVPNTGGLLGFICGNNDIADFGAQLLTLAKGIVDFSKTVKGRVDEEAVTVAANAGKVLTELADTVPNTGGLLGFICGNNDIAVFGAQLLTLAQGIVGFSTLVKGKIDEDAVKIAANSGKVLTELSKTVPNTGGLLGFLVGGNDIDKFGEKLPVLARGIVDFSDIVRGRVDGDAVTTASHAGETLAALSKQISETKTGGFWGFLNKGMSSFSQQIKLLGEGIASFSRSVSGKIDSTSVTLATNAGGLIAALSDRISETKTGGFWGFLNKGMKNFSEQIVSLGEGIAAFSGSVRGKVDAAAVTTATQAGALIATLSSSVSDATGSWISNLFGGDKKKFKNFKEQVPLLGEAIVAFSSSISGKISTNAVSSARTVAEVLNILSGYVADDLSNVTDIGESLTTLGSSVYAYYEQVSKLNVNKMNGVTPIVADIIKTAKGTSGADSTSIIKFGNAVGALGDKIKDYHDDITDMNQTAVTQAMAQVNKLISMAKNMAGLDTSGMTQFGKDLKKLGTNGIDDFIDAFEDADEDVKGAAGRMLTTFGEAAVAKTPELNTAFAGIVRSIITNLDKQYDSFVSAGELFANGIIAGVKNKASELKTAFATAAGSAVTEVNGKYDSFYSAGGYLVDGFAAGISASTYKAAAQARAMAKAAVEAAEAELDINSPSKVFYGVGKFSGLGFVNALADYADKSYEAGVSLADSARSGLSNAISKVVDAFDSDIDTQPTIRPVLDLTNVESGAKRINTMFARTQAMSIDIGNHHGPDEDQNGVASGKSGNTYSFTQNNYSPKALSRIDIYRQTKNQFSAIERMVEG